MPSITRSSQVAAALSLILTLSACGGGGDDPVAAAKVDDRIAPFLGRWVACMPITGFRRSEKDDLLISAGDPNEAIITRVYTQYDNSTDCTGPAVVLQEEMSEVTLLGQTVTVSGFTLEKFARTGTIFDYAEVPPGSGNWVGKPRAVPATSFASVVPGTTSKLIVGDDTTLDAEGIPQALTPAAYIKVP